MLVAGQGTRNARWGRLGVAPRWVPPHRGAPTGPGKSPAFLPSPEPHPPVTLVKLLVPMVGLLALLPVSLQAQVPSDEAAIREVRRQSNAAIARHDVPGILATLESGFRASTSNGSFIDSPAAMGEAFAGRFAAFDDATYVRTPQSVEVSTAGPLASEIGEWVGSWTTPEGPFRTGGRYAAYWRKTDGAWRIHAELFVPLYCEGPGCG